ncbi:putative nucleolar complex protein 14 [Smittium culicis]|uniref:Putative nucleolar complex protein 14 n=1 Tax=Smittium culicis TaxID=133412 RepID=A0A1R1YIP2_9FUNG|nr:putative nucleolar complex protein 14 [Smittium culicis]
MVANKQKSNKQSALKRLRSSLSSAGVIGPKASVSKKAKKKGVISQNKSNDEFQKQLSTRLKQIQTEMNPFETKVNNKKDFVLGRKLKGETGKPGLTRQIGVEKREKTLLVELQNINRTGGIRDRRFGENNPTVSIEEKMLTRFTKERQKRAKKNIYNLSDEGSGDDLKLTHLGQSLDEIDDFDSMGLNLTDDEDSGLIDASTVSNVHFGGFEAAGPNSNHGLTDFANKYPNAEGGEKKTKAQIMAEVIAKSKMHKYERQQIKEDDSIAMQNLDKEFDDLRSILASEGSFGPDKNSSSNTNERSNGFNSLQKQEMDSYDISVKSLIFEKRARPLDRLKTDEEIAADKKEALEKAERHRVRRMKGLDSDTDSSSDEESSRNMKTKKSKLAKSKRSKQSGDGNDIDSDDSNDDKIFGSGLEIDASGEADSNDDKSDDESGSEIDDEESGSEIDQESENESESDIGSGDENAEYSSLKSSGSSKQGINGKHSKISSPANVVSKKAASKISSSDEIPYTFEAPKDYNDWLGIIRNFDLDQQLIIADRIRVYYHLSLKSSNKVINENLLVIFMEHLAILSEQHPPVPLTIINGFSKHVSELYSACPVFAGNYSRELIVDFQSRLVKDLTNGVEEINNKDHTSQPSGDKKSPLASDLVQMKLLVSIFSSSDRYHSVVTPIMLVLGQYLSLSVITGVQDASKHLFVSGILYEAMRLSRRYIPEVINSLQLLVFSSLSGLINVNEYESKVGNGSFPLSNEQKKSLKKLAVDFSKIEKVELNKSKSKKKGKKAATESKAELKQEQPSFESLKIEYSWLTSDVEIESTQETSITLAKASMIMLKKFSDLYFSSKSYPEIFKPMLLILEKAIGELEKEGKINTNSNLGKLYLQAKELASHLRETIVDSFVEVKRVPLALQSHKPIAIRSVAPKFELGYSLDKHYGLDSERDKDELVKMQRLVKKETRGAIRELRKDASFMSQAKLEKQKEKDLAYDKKMKAVMSVLEVDQSEFNKQDRLKNKRKR